MLLEGRELIFQSVEEVARECLDRLSLQFNSKKLNGSQIFLGGWSYGGVVASVLAREILMSNQSPLLVQGLVLFDAPLRTAINSAAVNNGHLDETNDHHIELDSISPVSLKDRSVRHFTKCTSLLQLFHSRPRQNRDVCQSTEDSHRISSSSEPILLNCPVWDFRPCDNNQYDCGVDAALELVSRDDLVTRQEVTGTHWSMLFGENASSIAKIVCNILRGGNLPQ